MSIATLIRAASLAALVASTALAPVLAADVRAPVIRVAASEGTSRFIPLGKGKSVILDLPRDIKDVLVADPKVANAVVRSSRRVYIIGVEVGQTNIFFFDAHGRQIAGFDIAVKRDLNGMRAALRQSMPDSDIQIEGIGKEGIMLSGTAASPAESQQAYNIATQLAGADTKVVNGITVRGRDQVMLKVTVAEVERDIVKQLGVNINATIGYGTAVFKTNNAFAASGQAPPNSLTAGVPLSAGGNTISATLQAMDQAGVVRTLAEPTLDAISGETANFLVGGEFPYVKGTSGPPDYTPTIDFKKFGVSLVFTPVVLTEGRISLKVLTEVSELSTEGALSISGLSVPSLKTRRAETTVEIPSGGSLALAGMIKQQTKQAISGLPGIMQVPILGTLFKSRDYVNNQTELMIIVTPYIVHAVAEKKLSRPDDGFADPSDPSSILLGRLNRIYGRVGKFDPPPSEYHGKYGFILD
jgi:pilus assembly protein CpaC